MILSVHTLRFGDPDWMQFCAPTLEAWCERHGHTLTVHGDPGDRYPTPKLVEIDAIREFLKGKATHFAWVDADVYVHPDAPAAPEFEGIAMATDCYHAEHQDMWLNWCEEHFKERPDFAYSNAGIYFLDRKAAKQLLAGMVEPFVVGFQEQHLLNWWVHKSGIPVTRLPSEWNRFGADFEPAWMRHFWGTDKVRDFEEIRESGMLGHAPDGLRYSWHPGHTPHQDKVFYLQFVKDCGLGNQLFEAAAGIAMARQLGMAVRFNWKPTPKRDFGLEHFGFGVLPFREVPVVSSRLGQGNEAIVSHAMHAVTDTPHRVCAVSHPFQAEECFAPVADEVRERFKLEPLPLDIPEGRTPVAVQVRRGDYVGHPRLNVCTAEYYINGMDFIRGKIGHPTFFVVSDDPAWCQQHFGHLPDVVVMPPQEPIDGLRTMVACEAAVISNSTFGWWGAWLGEKGPVVVPEIWHHRPGSYGDWKPAPERWHRVSIGRSIAAKPVVSKPVPPVAFRRHKTEFDRAIVVPWHADQDKWQSLRYCLRSIHTNFEDRKCPIVILGTRRPTWLPYGRHRVRFEEAWSYQDALMRGVQIADEVLWMNDDILFLKPCGWEDVRRPLHFGPVTAEFLADFRARPNPWRDGFVKAVEWLAKQGTEVINNYSTHVPYVYKLHEAAEVLKRTGAAFKQPFETLYFNLHGTGARPMRDERTQVTPFGEARYLNHTNNHLTPELKEAIKARFPDFAPWEIKVKFDA